MRSLGDDYVKAGTLFLPMRLCRYSPLPLSRMAEFRRHREVSNPVHIIGFLSQWKKYLDELAEQSGTGHIGKKLDTVAFEKVNCSYHATLPSLIGFIR